MGSSGCQQREISNVPTPSLETPAVVDGTTIGNGGGDVQFKFIRAGNVVVDFLENSEEGQEFSKRHSLDVTFLRSVLTPKRIIVRRRASMLRDKFGSEVSARATDILELVEEDWEEHFNRGEDIEYLVFHEMLNLHPRISDSGYTISRELSRILPRPSLELAKFTPPGDSNPQSLRLKEMFPLVNPRIMGEGCPPTSKIHMDYGRGRLWVLFETFRFTFSWDVWSGTNPLDQWKLFQSRCEIEFPVVLKPHQRLLVTDLELQGVNQFSDKGGGTALVEILREGARVSRRLGPASGARGEFVVRAHSPFASSCGGEMGNTLQPIRLSAELGLDNLSMVSDGTLDVKSLVLNLATSPCKPEEIP